ncbi:hypothetical protein PVAP13_1KG170800 [Panicum virgatum]|uniref:Uncharacterized protein n=1 Tax=Panicum virgatum TaxID=38727 RepID=A0A8T0XFW6_PANVG|nr:hypothetical protein PVAP13_1KG170800 [Panicum virgatum]
MATTLSLSSPLFLAAPARARDVIPYGVASASSSWSTANALGMGYLTRVHDHGQKRHMAIVSEVKVGDQLQESGENVFVGGKNRWKYSTFVNWELWWPQFPILVYFKETQTKPEGQIHFFPVIFNGQQLYNVMVERAGPSKMSGPK